MSAGKKSDSWDSAGMRAAIDALYNQIPSSVEVDTASGTPAEAYRVAEQLNTIRDELDLSRFIETSGIDTVYTLSGAGIGVDPWPDGLDISQGIEEAWQQSGPVILGILERLNVIETNWDPGLRQWFLSGKTPGGDWEVGDDDFTSAFDLLKDAAAGYLEEGFPELAFSVKKDVAPLDDVPNELGPATISCDPNLEASLEFTTNQAHYIGRLEGEDGIFSSPYLPV